MLVRWIKGRSSSGMESTPLPEQSSLTEGTVERRNWVFHPFLFGVFPIVSVFSHNVFELPLTDLILPIGLSLASTLTIWLGLLWWTRDSFRAGLATSVLVVLFFGHASFLDGTDAAWNYLNEFWVLRETTAHPLVGLGLEGLLAAVGLWFIFRRMVKPRVWTSYLNLLTMILVCLPTAGLVSSKFGDVAMSHRGGALPTLGQKGATPDIYFIVLDGYARSDIMKELYGIDNQPFIERLERRGFVVAKRSTSNYCQTMLSVGSTMNADYLDKVVDLQASDLLQLGERIRNNQVLQLLRPRGYQIVAFNSGFDPTDMTDADLYLAPGSGPSAFNYILIEMTPLAMIFAETRWIDQFTRSRNRTQFILDRLPSIARIQGPTFTFAHILSPHPPFVFGEFGEDVSPRVLGPNFEVRTLDPFIGTPEYVRQSYRNQTKFLTRRVEQTIDRILELSPEPPVIVLQSDHGAWLRYHPNDVEATDLRERFGTLNAILIPGRKPIEGFNDDAVSVNTFRIVLNNLFGADLPLLERRSYFSTVLEPLKLIDVTARLHSDQERSRTFQPPKQYLGLLKQF
jgi:hypothetical protein